MKVPTSGRRFVTLRFWSDIGVAITLTNVFTTTALNDIVIPALPPGYRVKMARLIWRFRRVRDTSGLVNNRVSGADRWIQVRKSGGSWVNAMEVFSGDFYIYTANGFVGGNEFMSTDPYPTLVATVNGPGTYNVQWYLVRCTYNNLEFQDYQVGFELLLEAS